MLPKTNTTITNNSNESYSYLEEEEDNEDEEAQEEDEEEDPSDLSLSSSSSSSTSSSSHRSRYLHRSASSLLSQTNPFSPPFYNRPPTPLPPSPSFTSLLRPAFTSTSTPTVSRPTTPDDTSDPEAYTPNDTDATFATNAHPIPPATPRVPTYEYYGFVLYLVSSLAFLMYILWSYLPSPFLHRLGLYYYPNRWWSLAIPAWLVMFVTYIYVALAAYNTRYLTLPMHSVECLVDEQGKIAVLSQEGRNTGQKGGKRVEASQRVDWRDTIWNKGTDAVMDVPIGAVCEILYGGDDGDPSDGCDEEKNDGYDGCGSCT